jgi:hypothetical protein
VPWCLETISKRESEVKINLSGWDKEIWDAKKGIARLKIALEDCEKKKAAGEPWPGGNSDAAPSV